MASRKPLGKTAVMAAITGAAAVLISERGTSSITLRDIARKANVNHALIIRHFGTKEKLVKAVGLSLVNSMFEETRQSSENLLDILLDWDNRYSVNMRAIIRIMLDDPDGTAIVDAKPLIDGLLVWINEGQKKLHISPDVDSVVLVFIFACLVFGDELFGPYISKIMNISRKSYKLLRPKIFQTVLSGMQQASLKLPG
jgi:TetR/AcrR family transcriptional regulator, repressor for neighboring sulfatase